MAKTMTQNEWVFLQLAKGRKLTPFLAYDEYGITRLGARIFDLRQEGYPITAKTLTVVNRRQQICHVAEYSF